MPGQTVLAYSLFSQVQYLPAVIIRRESTPPNGVITYTVAGIGEAHVLTQGRVWFVTAEQMQLFKVDIPIPSTSK